MELKWLGHSSWQIKTGDKIIYLDPYEGSYEDEADVILCSHHHDDHCNQEKINQTLKESTKIIGTEECSRKLDLPITTLNPGETAQIDEVIIKAVEAYNVERESSPGKPYHPKGLGVGYLVTAEGKTVYHVGDTDVIPKIKQIKNVDLILIPIGGTNTLDIPDATEITLEIKPKKAVPMHRGLSNPLMYKEAVESSGDTEVVILLPGETLTL